MVRPDYAGILLLSSAVVSFNGGLWQIYRHRQKVDLLESHKNLAKPALEELPELPLEKYNPKEIEYRRVKFEGSFDNDGSVIVGPRSLPSFRGPKSSDEKNSGFIVMTPFEIKDTKQFIMVNRGWVPIDAGKHRTMLAKYIGEGFKPITLNGIFRRDEYVMSSFFSGDSPENHQPMMADLSWFVIRPFEMLKHYYKKRWGEDDVDKRVEVHGARHFYVEMTEDFQGIDQKIIRGAAWPRRRDTEEITYVHLPPMVHAMYCFFWFFVSAGSLYGLSLCFKRQKMIFADRKMMEKACEDLNNKRQKESAAYLAATAEVEARIAAEKAARR
eukprot:Tbor_TRINITY_DN9169_c0_g1::TRINITY_DN9169_c0_g1_i1::g.14467::m.14467/K14998/SURF1, SHY1; surfeit locus 1 family protein